MGFYETTYILHSALQEGRLNDIVKTIEKKAESLGAKFLYSDNWGRKKLAYLIDKEKYGTYIFVQYSLADSRVLKELSAEFEHNPNVLRYLNIKIEEEDIFQKITTEDVSDSDKSDDKESAKTENEQSVDSKKESKEMEPQVEEGVNAEDSQEEKTDENSSQEGTETKDDDKEENSGDNE
jgi:small subunit ribosomal protein S6